MFIKKKNHCSKLQEIRKEKKGLEKLYEVTQKGSYGTVGSSGTPALFSTMAGPLVSQGAKNHPHSKLDTVTAEIQIRQLLPRRESALGLELPGFKTKFLKLMHLEYSH